MRSRKEPRYARLHATHAKKQQINCCFFAWCPGSDSNRHDVKSGDFKSPVSAIPPPGPKRSAFHASSLASSWVPARSSPYIFSTVPHSAFPFLALDAPERPPLLRRALLYAPYSRLPFSWYVPAIFEGLLSYAAPTYNLPS